MAILRQIEDAPISWKFAINAHSDILLIDPDHGVAEAIAQLFEDAGQRLVHVPNAEQAAERLRLTTPRAIVLEWSLSGLSGVELTRRLRAHPRSSHIPILMLTSRATERDRLVSFDSGADDFLAKPFSARELVARVHSLMRRIHGSEAPADFLRVGSLVLDLRAQRVTADGREISLGLTERRILELLIRQANRVMSRAQIITQVWAGASDINERTVDVHIRRLRANLEPSGHDVMLQTLRGEGYMFVIRKPDGPDG